jgi:hypothetical protein
MNTHTATTRPLMHVRMLSVVVVTLAALMGTHTEVRAMDESPDLKIELIGLPLSNTQRELQVRVTNVSTWWATDTMARVETVSPIAGNVLQIDVENLDPGQSVTFPYTLAAACNGQVVKAEVSSAKNYEGVPESNVGNNQIQSQACPAQAPVQSLTALTPPQAAPKPPAEIKTLPRDTVLVKPIDPNIPVSNMLRSNTAGDVLRPAPRVNEDLLKPESQRLGTHTVALEVGQSLPKLAGKFYPNWQLGCTSGGVDLTLPTEGFLVGFEQLELLDKQCAASVIQANVLFDTGLLDQVPSKTIDRAVLTYDEARASTCYGGTALCWRSGGGTPEPKPNGCVVLGVPTVNWPSDGSSGLIPLTTPTEVKRLATREWDVTEPFNWQYTPGAAPLGATPGFGFLLAGGFSRLDQLEAMDNTTCMSLLTNVHLNVTYTVYDDEPFRAPK